jgi:hypothetical protein
MPPPVSDQLLHQDFAKAYSQINNPRFLNMEGIGGEVPFYLFTYDPTQETAVAAEIDALGRKLYEAGHTARHVNIFTLCYELLREKIDLDDLYELEEDDDREVFLETLQSLLDLETVLVPAIVNKINDPDQAKADVLFLSGVGQVFPFLRAHSLLNNLQARVTQIPTVMFFPGVYTGTSMELFGRLKNDNYYRAFHLNNLNLA